MKTKLLALCLLAALVAGLAGCGKADADPTASVDPQEVEQQQDEFNPKGIVLMNEGGLTITVDDLRQGDSVVELDLELENTSRQDLNVTVANCSVNGYMAGVYFDCTVPAEDSSWETATIYIDDLAELGITDVADLALSFSIDAQASGGGYTRTSPRSITMPRAALYDYSTSLLQQAMDDPEWIEANGYQILCAATDLYDQDAMALLSAYLVQDLWGDRYLYLELANSATGQTVADLGDITLNGAQLTQANYSRYTIDAGKRKLVTLSLEYLISQAPQGDYDQLREVGFALNDTAIQLPISA